MFPRTAAIYLGLLLIFGLPIGDDSSSTQSGVSASTASQVPIVEQALRSVGLAVNTLDEDTRIYAARVSIEQLEAWLRDSEIRTAARVQNRPVNDVRGEWDEEGLGRLPAKLLADHDSVWVIDIRGGVSYQSGTKLMPLTLPPDHLKPQSWAPPEFDNVHVILSDDAVQIGIGAFTEHAVTPPLGVMVDPDHMFDDEYMVEVAHPEKAVHAVLRDPTQGLRIFLPSVGVGADQSQLRFGWLVDRSLAQVDSQCSTVPGETTDIYARFGPVDSLETWLRDAAITQAAVGQGRPVDEVRQEWDASGLTFLPPSVLNHQGSVWFIDTREGIRCLPGPMMPPPGGVLPVYNNIYMLLDAEGSSLGMGAFSELSYWTPPFGELIHSVHW